MQPQGDLDLASSPELERILRTELEARRQVTLDLSQVPFMDSTGLNTILIAVRDSGAGRGSLRISPSLPDQVHRVFELAGVQRMLPLTDE